MKSPPTVLFLSLLPLSTCWAFVTPSSSSISSFATTKSSRSSVSLSATKKNKKKRSSSSSGEGFGNKSSIVESAFVRDDDEAASDNFAASVSAPRALQSIDGPSYLQQQNQQPTIESLNLDPNLSPEERSQAILSQKFGLKSYEQQQADLGDYRLLQAADEKKAKRNAIRNLDKVWPEDKDFVAVLPPVLIKAVDTFLKVGLGACTGVFLVAGVAIMIEAGSKATGKALPEGLGEFVVDVVQPNFTPGLGVLLLFSVSLGVFTLGLGGSAASSYKERP